MSKAKMNTFTSVWDAIADTAEEATNMRVRSELMSKLAEIIEVKGWTQEVAAKHCGVTQPRINDLLRGRLSRFSLDALVNLATALGQHVHVELNAVERTERSRIKAAVPMPATRARISESRPRPKRLKSSVSVRGGVKKKSTHAP